MSKPENNRRKKPAAKKINRKGILPSRKGYQSKSTKESQIASKPSDSGHTLSEEVKSSDLFEITENELFETLLDVPNRKPLPQFPQSKTGRKNKLVELIRFSPRTYAKMIEKLRMGVSPNVAAQVCDVAERTFHEWGEKGAIDAENEEAVEQEDGSIIYEHDPIDSIYSRFYYDVRRAIAVRVAEAEIKMAEEDPLKWLSRGAGRIFGNKWGKNPEKQQSLPNGSSGNPATSPHQQLPTPSGPDDIVEGTFTVQPKALPAPSEAAEEKGHTRLKSTLEEEYEALKIWDATGQFKMSDEMKKAYEDQINTEKQDITLDGEEDNEDD